MQNNSNNSDQFQIKDILKLPTIFWLLMINWFFVYWSYSHMNISNDYMCIRYGFDPVEAARVNSNSFLLCLFLAPIYGIISDKIGNRLTFMLLSTVFLSWTQLLYIFIPSSTSDNKTYLGYVPIILEVVASSSYSCMIFPLISMVTKQDALGAAYGINASLINFALSFSPLIVGALTFKGLKENTYLYVNIAALILWTISVILTVVIMIYNINYLDWLLQKVIEEHKQDEVKLLPQDIERSDINHT